MDDRSSSPLPGGMYRRLHRVNVETVGVCPVVISTNPSNLSASVALDQIITPPSPFLGKLATEKTVIYVRPFQKSVMVASVCDRTFV